MCPLSTGVSNPEFSIEQMTLKIDYSQFSTADQNMTYDHQQLDGIQTASDVIFRIYQWGQTAGITLPKNRTLPHLLNTCDWANRPTGGGIVFHSPGDVLFTLIAHLNHPLLPLTFKKKLEWISNEVRQCLSQLIPIDTMPPKFESSEMTYCNSYPNPYELYHHSHKIVGMAQRRLRHAFILQGVIHIYANHSYFDPFFSPYLTDGLQGKICPKEVIQTMTQWAKAKLSPIR